MRFMMLVKASQASAAGADMEKYNEQLARAGVLLDLSSLEPASKGTRVRFEGGKRSVVEGPLQESIGGYWLIQAKSKDEAIEWAKRVPFHDGEIEIRRLEDLSTE